MENRTTSPPVTRAQLTVVAGVLVLYAALSYYGDSLPDSSGLGLALSLGPLLLIASVFLWRWTSPWMTLLTALAVGVAIFRYWPWLKLHYPWSNLFQQCGAYGLIAWGFARSLFGGRVPLCTQMEEKLYGPLSPAEQTYLRLATLAWSLFYAGLTVTIAVLFFAVAVSAWSLFVNFASFGLMGLMLVIEHTIRRRFLPHRRRGMLEALRQLLVG